MKRIQRNIILAVICLLGLCSIRGYAQQDKETVFKSGVQFDTTVVFKKKHKPEHLLGLRYDFSFTGVTMTPDMDARSITSPVNLAVMYTYYHPKWATMDFFGLQMGLRYTKFGFEQGDYYFENFEQTVTSFELPFLSAFHFDIKEQFRALVSLGPFVGYRAFTTKDNGFDCYDIRFDYGVEGGIGFAYRLKDIVEFHLEGVFRYSFAMLYDPEKFSSQIWVYTYPWQASICLGVYFRLK